MSEFHLKIVTPDRLVFDSLAKSIVARTVTGDVCILARHTEYIAPLAIGQIKVKSEEGERRASCSGGTLIVTNGEVTVLADTFEWEDEIDIERAERAKARAEERLKSDATDFEFKLAEIKLKRAINRIKTGKM